MKTHDEQQLEGGKKPTKAPGTKPDNIEGSLRDLQGTAGNRAVSDLVAGSGPALQRSLFGGGFGGVEDWMAKESSASAPGFDASVKQDASDASVKQDPSDSSMKVADASDKWDSSQKFDAADKWDSSQKVDASDKWDSSQKLDASDKVGLVPEARCLGQVGLVPEARCLGQVGRFPEARGVLARPQALSAPQARRRWAACRGAPGEEGFGPRGRTGPR